MVKSLILIYFGDALTLPTCGWAIYGLLPDRILVLENFGIVAVGQR